MIEEEKLNKLCWYAMWLPSTRRRAREKYDHDCTASEDGCTWACGYNKGLMRGEETIGELLRSMDIDVEERANKFAEGTPRPTPWED